MEEHNFPKFDELVMDGEKKELFQKSRVFAEFLMKTQEKHLSDVIDQVFTVIGVQKIKREIDQIEFNLIQKLSKIEKSEFHDSNVMFFHDSLTNHVSMFFLLDQFETANNLKAKLETNFYFDLPHQMEQSHEVQPICLCSEKKPLMAKRMNEILLSKQKKCKVYPIKNEATTFFLKKFDEKSLIKFKKMLLKEFSGKFYFFNLIIDLPQNTLLDFASELEKKIENDDFDFTFSYEKFEHYEPFFNFIPKQELTSIKFLGKGSQLFKYFKSKPKCLFQTSICYLFGERRAEIDRILSKMMFKEILEKIDQLFSDSLFIVLSNLVKDSRLFINYKVKMNINIDTYV